MTELSSDYKKWAARQEMDEAQDEISKLEATIDALVDAVEDLIWYIPPRSSAFDTGSAVDKARTIAAKAKGE